MSGRKLNVDELKLHQAALATNERTLSIKDAEKLIPDGSARTAAINFLLGAGMFKVMTSSGGVTAFRAVMKKEVDLKKDMSGEETMVLSHIQASGNEGIWTKHLKAKTELHQTVIDRCLKSLVQKHLVKSIKAVRHPTRKIYMLAHLEPSVELTGGPWYTDNELDTEFIKLLSTACLHYIRDRSFPKKRSSNSQQRLYAIGAAPTHPSAQQIKHFLSKSKITETELGVDHVEMLLRVLELDGEIEKMPVFAVSPWDSKAESDAEPSSSSEDSDEERSSSKKRKRASSKNNSKESSKRRRRRTEDNSEDGDPEEERLGRKKKKRSRNGDDGNDDINEPKSKKKRKHNKPKKVDDSDSNTDSEESERGSHREKKRKGKSKKRDTSPLQSLEGTESEDEDERLRSTSKARASKKASTSKVSVKRQKSPPVLNEIPVGDAFVYRAIRQERVALGWSQAPCGRCPVFDFCRAKGPTNPQECLYYEEWYNLGTGAQKPAEPAAVKVEF